MAHYTAQRLGVTFLDLDRWASCGSDGSANWLAPGTPSSMDLLWIMELAVHERKVDPGWFRVFALAFVDSQACIISPLLLFKQETEHSKLELVTIATFYSRGSSTQSEWLMMRMSSGYIVSNSSAVRPAEDSVRYHFTGIFNHKKLTWECEKDLFMSACRGSPAVALYDARTGRVLMDKCPYGYVLDTGILVFVPDPPHGTALTAEYLKQKVPSLSINTRSCYHRLPCSTVVQPDSRDFIIANSLQSHKGKFLPQVVPSDVSELLRFNSGPRYVRFPDVIMGDEGTHSVYIHPCEYMRVLPAFGEDGQATSLVVSVSNSLVPKLQLRWSNATDRPLTMIAVEMCTTYISFQGVLFVRHGTSPEGREYNFSLYATLDHKCWVKWFKDPELTNRVLAFHCGCYHTQTYGFKQHSVHSNVITMSRAFIADRPYDTTVEIIRNSTAQAPDDPALSVVIARIVNLNCPIKYALEYTVRGYAPQYAIHPSGHDRVADGDFEVEPLADVHRYTVQKNGVLVVTREHPGRVDPVNIHIKLSSTLSSTHRWSREFKFRVVFADALNCVRSPEAMIMKSPDGVYYRDEFPTMQFVDCSQVQSKFWKNAERLFMFQQRLYEEDRVPFKVVTAIHVTGAHVLGSIMEHGFGVPSKPTTGRLGGDAVYFDPLTPTAPAFKLFWNAEKHKHIKTVLICSVIVPDLAPRCDDGNATVACEYGVSRMPCPDDKSDLYILVFPGSLGTHVVLRHVLLPSATHVPFTLHL